MSELWRSASTFRGHPLPTESYRLRLTGAPRTTSLCAQPSKPDDLPLRDYEGLNRSVTPRKHHGQGFLHRRVETQTTDVVLECFEGDVRALLQRIYSIPLCYDERIISIADRCFSSRHRQSEHYIEGDAPKELPEHGVLWDPTRHLHCHGNLLVVIVQVHYPSLKVRAQDSPYVRREAHALEGLVDHIPWNGVEGIPDIEADGHSIAASITRVHEMFVKRAQRVVGIPILPGTKLPIGQSDPGIGHEPLHPVHQ